MELWTPDKEATAHDKCEKIMCQLDAIERCYHDHCKSHDFIGYGITMKACTNCKNAIRKG